MKNNKVVLTYYYTGIFDKWHHKETKTPNVADFDTLWDSVAGRGYDFITLANELYPDTKRSKLWKVVELSGNLKRPDDMSLYLHKFIACYKYLLMHPEYEEIWIVDTSDTEMLATPDPEEGKIYTGYDAYFPAFGVYATFLWFLGGWADGVYVPQGFGRGKRNGDFEVRYLKDLHEKDRPYNCGVFGGKREIVMKFLKDFCKRLLVNDIDLEMVPFNYLCYTKYAGKVENCTTRMTLGEKDYNRWWRHK